MSRLEQLNVSDPLDLAVAQQDAAAQQNLLGNLRIRVGIAAAGVIALIPGNPAAGDVQPVAPEPTALTNTATNNLTSYEYKFASSPDMLNYDLGDTRTLKTYHKGSPNSYNAMQVKGFKTVLNAIKAEGVTDVAVAGDLVEGHWGMDTQNTGLFGPTNTYDQKKAAVKRAAHLYYGNWVDTIQGEGLHPLPAIGDHEIGDNPWKGKGGGMTADYNAFKQDTVQYWKRQFGHDVIDRIGDGKLRADHPKGPAANTAYAIRLHPEVELISLDVFKSANNDIETQLDPQQMKWLREKLQQANDDGVDWKVVQFHTPIIGPVRKTGSSGLMYKGGENSELWKVLKENNVNLVLNGEVHNITAHQPQNGDPVQLTHGGITAWGLANYATITVTPDSLNIVSMDFHRQVSKNHRFWQTDHNVPMPMFADYDPKSFPVGTLTIDHDNNMVERSGMLDVYQNKP